MKQESYPIDSSDLTTINIYRGNVLVHVKLGLVVCRLSHLGYLPCGR